MSSWLWFQVEIASARNAAYTAAYTYSADGLRLRAQESNHQYPDRWFQYDGVRPTQEGTLDGDDWTTLARYEWEGDSYYDPLVQMLPSGFTWRHPLYDGLGSTRQLLDDDQAVTDTYQYEAFGNLLGSTGTTPNPYRYVGSLGYYQTGSSLQHLGARYYLPEVGRFTARDARESESRYAYVENGPTMEVDPTGLYSIIGASGPIKERIKKAADDLCARVPATATPEITACTYPLQDAVLSGLKTWCNEGKIIYEGLGGRCRGGRLYGYTYHFWGRLTIHLCLPSLDPRELGPTIVHEIMHELGYPWEDVPRAMECCFYP